jgi:hypothetical protein
LDALADDQLCRQPLVPQPVAWRLPLLRRLSVMFAVTLIVAATAVPTYASSANGELCSVQTYDGDVRAGAYTADNRTARTATRHQLDNAAGWCTNQIAVNGWMGADKNYDRYTGQRDICWIHFPGDDVDIMIHADSAQYAVDFANQMCSDVAGGNMRLVYWY